MFSRLSLTLTLVVLIVVLPAYSQDSERIEDKEMGIRFMPPEGWQATKEADRYILGSPSFNGFVLLKTELLHSIDELKEAMETGIALKDGSMMQPVEELKMLGQQGVSGIYRGEVDDVEMTGYLIALMSLSKQRTVLCMSVSPTPNFNQSNLDYVKILVQSVIFD